MTAGDIDRQIAALLKQRRSLAGDSSAPVADDLPARVRRTTDAVATSEPDLPAPLVHGIWREIVLDEFAAHAPVTVAYLGPAGSFTHQAALNAFGEQCLGETAETISGVFHSVEKQNVCYGVVPIENSTEGAVTHTFDMFQNANVGICGEILLPIHHSLLSNCELSEVTTVCSHPQALAQCRGWLQQHLPHVDCVAVSSTTRAAEKAAQSATTAAIAGLLAAELYHLPVRAENIEDMADNTTRFLVIGRDQPAATGDDKTSVVIVLRDRIGGLHTALSPFSQHGINLTMIQSRPQTGNWQYCFFIDYEGHADSGASKQALEDLQACCQSFRVLGSYPRATLNAK